MPWKGGPGQYGKSVISPQAVDVTQSIESHIEAYAPGAYGQKHGHLNSAVFYVLKGRGHDVHDGRHIPWKAGDVMIVENGCVHQHFNDDPDEEAILLVFKAKPLFLFMHLLFQKIVEWPPKNCRRKGAEELQAAGGHSEARGQPCHRSSQSDKGAGAFRHQHLHFRADDIAASQEFRKTTRAHQRRQSRGHAVGAVRRRTDQASRPSRS